MCGAFDEEKLSDVFVWFRVKIECKLYVMLLSFLQCE